MFSLLFFRDVAWQKHVWLSADFVYYPRCGPYFGTIVEAVQCLTYQTERNVQTCKKETNILWFGVCGRKNFFTLSPSFKQKKSQKSWKISLSYSFAVEMAHFDIVRWKYNSVCIFSMLQDTLELILWKKADKTCKVKKRSIVFTKGVLIGKSIFQIKRINPVRGRCSSSGVLRHIPSKFTRSLRRRIVL